MNLQSSLRTPLRPALKPRALKPRVLKPRTRAEEWARKKAVAQSALQLSDYFFLIGLLLALFYVADPFRLGLERIGITKHLPFMVAVSGILLTNIGNWLFSPVRKRRVKHWQVFHTGLPLVLLGLWIVIGSTYARKVAGVNATFLTVGLYMLFAFMTARVIMLSKARAKIVRYFLLATGAIAIFMIVSMAVTIGSNNLVSYHEMEALVVPIAVYFALRPMGNQHWQALLTLTFLVGGLVFRKNTGFLVLGITLAYMWIVEWRFRFRESSIFRFWTVLWVVILIGAGTTAWGYIAYQRGEIMPTGNPEYRMRTYERAWEGFLASPVWGTSFSAPATHKFEGYQIKVAHGVLATHSDVLDLAAQGGTIALLLWVWGYIRIIRFSIRHSLRGRPRDDLHAAAHALACMSLASIVVYAFNPILLQPAKAMLLWGELGMLIGIGLHFANSEKAADAKTESAPATPSTAISKAKS